MGRKLSDASVSFSPTALIKQKGAMLKGTILDRREIKTQYGPKAVYSLKALDADCKFTQGKTEVEVAIGDKVDVIPPTRLALQLAQAKIGETVTIKYLGTKPSGKGQPAHIFDVEVE